MSRIGVEVTTTIRTGPTQTGPVSGRFHIPAITETGPVDKPVLVRSMAEFQEVFGTRTPYASNAYDTARLFFEEGGAELIVSRVVGPAAVSDTLALKDGEGVDTLRVQALHPGTNIDPHTVAVTATAGGATVTVTRAGKTLGRYVGATPAEIATAASRSRYVSVRDLGSETAAPGNLPVVVASTPLVGGSDDRASITASLLVAALDAAGEFGEGCMVAAPGYPSSAVGSLLIAHALRFKKVVIIAEDEDASDQEALEAAEALISASGAYGGLAWPWIIIPDGSGTRVISPEGYAAAKRNKAHEQVGAWRKPFGDIAIMQWALGTNKPVSKELNDKLSEGQVNGIITANGKTRLYNWVSLATDRENLGSIRDRDFLNNLGRELKIAYEPFVSADNDSKGHLSSQLESIATGICADIADRGGLYARFDDDGEEIDPGYKVVVDSSNNSLSSMAQNSINVQVFVRLSPSADLILVEIIKVPLEGVL